MIRKLLCCFGFHKWESTEGEKLISFGKNITIYGSWKQCVHCQKEKGK